MRVDDDVARQTNKDNDSDKDEIELILDRDYIQVRRRVRVTYLRHFVPSLLFQEMPARAQLTLTRFQGRNRVCPFLPLRAPFAFQFTLGTFQRFPPRSPPLLALLLFPLQREYNYLKFNVKNRGTLLTNLKIFLLFQKRGLLLFQFLDSPEIFARVHEIIAGAGSMQIGDTPAQKRQSR